MTETLFGIPTGPFTIGEVAGMGPMAIQFQQWLQGVFAPNGVDGAPDPATDPMSSYAYLSNRARVINGAAQQRPLVRLADKNLNIVAQLTEEMSCDFEELMSDSGHAKYVVRYENWLVDFILNLFFELAGSFVPLARKRPRSVEVLAGGLCQVDAQFP